MVESRVGPMTDRSGPGKPNQWSCGMSCKQHLASIPSMGPLSNTFFKETFTLGWCWCKKVCIQDLYRFDGICHLNETFPFGLWQPNKFELLKKLCHRFLPGTDHLLNLCSLSKAKSPASSEWRDGASLLMRSWRTRWGGTSFYDSWSRNSVQKTSGTSLQGLSCAQSIWRNLHHQFPSPPPFLSQMLWLKFKFQLMWPRLENKLYVQALLSLDEHPPTPQFLVL